MLPMRHTIVLISGDVIIFLLSIWIALAIRTLSVPSYETFWLLLKPFSLLIAIWIASLFLAGVYDRRQLIFQKRELIRALVGAQTINVVIGALFFFSFPYFGVTPKTVLFIYLISCIVLSVIWHTLLSPTLELSQQGVAIVLSGNKNTPELVSVIAETNNKFLRIIRVIAPSQCSTEIISSLVRTHDIDFIIADLEDSQVTAEFPRLLDVLFQSIEIIDEASLYEEVFGRVALAHVDDRWIAQNISLYAHVLYDEFKRIMDITIALGLAIPATLIFPLIALAIKFEDGGQILIAQERVGKNRRLFRLYKIRSMERNETALDGRTPNPVTRVGAVLRAWRLDELPQIWNVLRGDLSIVGPRPELPAAVELYKREIPYYDMRHLITPGLTGWAQVYHDNHPHHSAAVSATQEKLSYDLYYIKNRSLLLDLSIATRTIWKVLARAGK